MGIGHYPNIFAESVARQIWRVSDQEPNDDQDEQLTVMGSAPSGGGAAHMA